MVNINGKTYNGNNVMVKNNKVYIDDKLVDDTESKIINIQIDSPVNNLHVDNCEKISINGNVDEVSLTNGDVSITGNVNGNIKTLNGSIKANLITGTCNTTNGDIKYVKLKNDDVNPYDLSSVAKHTKK